MSRAEPYEERRWFYLTAFTAEAVLGRGNVPSTVLAEGTVIGPMATSLFSPLHARADKTGVKMSTCGMMR